LWRACELNAGIASKAGDSGILAGALGLGTNGEMAMGMAHANRNSQLSVAVIASTEVVTAEVNDGRPDTVSLFGALDEPQREQLALDAWSIGLRVPASLPAGFAWEASIVIDGFKMARARATAKPGRTRTLTDLAANISKLSGVHQVGVRLELVGV
jgi:hypothetical protein